MDFQRSQSNFLLLYQCVQTTKEMDDDFVICMSLQHYRHEDEKEHPADSGQLHLNIVHKCLEMCSSEIQDLVNYSATSYRASCFTHHRLMISKDIAKSTTVSTSVRFGLFHPYHNMFIEGLCTLQYA